MSFHSIDDLQSALDSDTVSVRDLYTAWAQRQPLPVPSGSSTKSTRPDALLQIRWLDRDTLSLARRFTERALEKEEFLLVCDAAREALSLWPVAGADGRTDLVWVRIHYARALTRLGFTAEARTTLEPCAADSFRPVLSRGLKVDILLQLGNIMREEAQQASARSGWRHAAEEALLFYERALQIDPARLDALALAAAAAFVVGDPNSSSENRDGPRFRWTLFQAVAHVVLGDPERAAAAFAALQALEDSTFTLLADARFWARALAEGLGLDSDYFKPAFPPLQLIVFAGHVPDIPGREGVFPPDAVGAVRDLIKAKLEEAKATVALVSATAGAELLFVEAMLARKGDVHLVLPWSKEEFRRTSVSQFEPAGKPPIWGPLFDTALEQAATIRELGQAYKPSTDLGLLYMLEVVAGMAFNSARMWRLDVLPMVLWNRLPGRGAGGPESFFQLWSHRLSQQPAILDMPAPQMPQAFVHERSLPSSSCEMPMLQQQVKSMLFADIVGYSKLREDVIPGFVGVFMQRVSRLVASSPHAPRTINTWGDAIYAVFDFADDAGCFAIELIQMILDGEKDWLAQGLSWDDDAGAGEDSQKRPLSIRVGLHTGPVFLHYDPVVRELGYTGVHVSRAARIEPVARPGEIYASEEFAAFSELETEIGRRPPAPPTGGASTGFACEYAGSMQLAKHYPGRHRIYRLVPRHTFAIEDLAQAAHESYCIEARARGETIQTNVALRPWEELPDDLRQANRAQVADIPNKLRDLGYEISPGYGMHPSEMVIPDALVEELSVREHARWMRDRQRQGWTYAPVRDNTRQHHPLLVPWEQLSEPEKEKDRDTVRNLPHLVEKAGLRVRKISQ
jgi:tetratricopeptide (TPR) repeat protein